MEGMLCYTRPVNTKAQQVVRVRLFLEGKVVEYDMPGPLVAMPVKTRKGSK
jgi:hypothetical protein